MGIDTDEDEQAGAPLPTRFVDTSATRAADTSMQQDLQMSAGTPADIVTSVNVRHAVATALRIDRAQVRRQEGHNLVSVVGTKGAKASRIEDLLSSTGGAPSTARGESRLAGLREAGKAAREGKGSEETGPITQWYSRRVDRLG